MKRLGVEVMNMPNIFCKIFTVGEYQLLVEMTESEDGYPQLRLHTRINDQGISASPTFGPADESKPFNEEYARRKLKSAFDMVSQAEAENTIGMLLELYAGEFGSAQEDE